MAESKHKQLRVQALLIIGLIIFLNLLASRYFYRWDLTKEKRYSLSEVSKQTAKELEAPMLISIYLDGDFPPLIRKFQETIRTTILELKQYGGYRLEFEFVDPSQSPELLKQFQERGFIPIPVRIRTSATDVARKNMFPYAKFRYKGREQYVDLLKGCVYPTGEVNFEKAEADLEYKLVSVMRNLTKEQGGLLVMLQGHGEKDLKEIPQDLGGELLNTYNFATFNMKENPGMAISPDVDVILIFDPTEPFSERDKYELDQYLIRGGNILWLVGQETVDLDLYQKRATLTDLRELNLDDMFNRYGFKINYDLIQDINCEKTEVFREGPSGGIFDAYPWIFYPLIYSFSESPINRNVETLLLRNASSIDTFAQENVKKSVIMTTSPNSRTVEGKQFIDLNQYLLDPPPEQLFIGKGPHITGLLLEGQFNSVFTGRVSEEILLDSLAKEMPTATFGAQNNPIAPGKMVVISDGDFASSKSNRGQASPYLPYDNKTFLMNAIDYLAGDIALTQIRSKEVVARNLNKRKIAENETLIKSLNLLLPISLILLFGLARYVWRKRKFSSSEKRG
ncbi:MAG: gliding motility-associated ABC transporter substrate-binding protein GldG [Bacteroidota bacterium]